MPGTEETPPHGRAYYQTAMSLSEANCCRGLRWRGNNSVIVSQMLGHLCQLNESVLFKQTSAHPLHSSSPCQRSHFILWLTLTSFRQRESKSLQCVNTTEWSSRVYKTIVFCLCPACAAYGSFHGCWRAWLMGRAAVGLVLLMCSAWQGESEALGEVTRGKSGYIGAGGRRRFHQTATEGSHLCQITLQAQKLVSKRRFFAQGFGIFWRNSTAVKRDLSKIYFSKRCWIKYICYISGLSFLQCAFKHLMVLESDASCQCVSSCLVASSEQQTLLLRFYHCPKWPLFPDCSNRKSSSHSQGFTLFFWIVFSLLWLTNDRSAKKYLVS